ncbi:MAG: hypothetical protein H6Q06_2977 [Acidobacteria bacterium]|nr:hypothetical protein [Acidobacteriota bacterium]
MKETSSDNPANAARRLPLWCETDVAGKPIPRPVVWRHEDKTRTSS